jgi:hypothetical protein
MTAPISTLTPTKNIANERAEVEKLFTLADVDPVGRTECMIYGAPGTGKTVFASTFPGPQRWISADGATSLKSIIWAIKAGKTALKDPKDLVAYAPTEVPKGHYIDTATAFNKMQDMIWYWFKPDQVDGWSTLVLDSFTQINDWAMDLGLGLNTQYPTAAKPLSTSDAINRKAMTRLVVGQQDYKSAMGLIEGFLRNVRAECARHNKHLVILCHEHKDTAEGSNGGEVVVAITPSMIGQLRTKLVKDFDDVWYMEKYNESTGIKIKVNLNGSAKIVGKTRWGSIFTREQDPDYRTLIAEVKKFHGQ